MLDSDGALVLAAPPPVYDVKGLVKQLELRDALEVRTMPGVVNQLRRAGIEDLEAHFLHRLIRATGKPEQTLIMVYTGIAQDVVIVDGLEDLEVLSRQPASTPERRIRTTTQARPQKAR